MHADCIAYSWSVLRNLFKFQKTASRYLVENDVDQFDRRQRAIFPDFDVLPNKPSAVCRRPNREKPVIRKKFVPMGQISEKFVDRTAKFRSLETTT